MSISSVNGTRVQLPIMILCDMLNYMTSIKSTTYKVATTHAVLVKLPGLCALNPYLIFLLDIKIHKS